MKNRLLILLLLSHVFCFGKRNIDSLIRVINTSTSDSIKIATIAKLANEYTDKTDFEKAAQQIKQGYALAEKMPNEYCYAFLYRSDARLSREKGELDEAIDYYLKAVKIFEKFGSAGFAANCYGSVANLYYEQGQFNKSIDCMHKAVVQYEKDGDKKSVAGYLGNMGAVYESIKNYDKALELYNKAMKANKELNNKQGLALNYICIANLYIDWLDYDKALEYQFKALEINTEFGDSAYISNNINNIAITYRLKKDYAKALEYSEKAIIITPKTDVYLANTNRLNAANIYIGLKQYKKAEKYLLEIEKSVKAFNSLSKQQYTYSLLSTVYDSLGNYKKSLEYFRLQTALGDSIYNDENRKKIMESQVQFEYAKKAAADSLMAVEEKKLVEVKLKQERTQNIALIVVVILVGIFAIFIFNRFRITNKQKKIIEEKEKETQVQKGIIEEKHREITDSINYAERIQRSFMATNELLSQGLGNYFLLFKPKDIVSGDFYWAYRFEDGKVVLVTADSTGHGVPGAIVSLLNITSIESAIKSGHNNPAEILNETRKQIITRLANDGSEEGGKDGMDCSVCLYDFAQLSLTVSAANNGVWIIRNGNQELENRELIEINADKMPVGRHQKQDIPFSSHTITLQKGDIVYTFTDGYADQFGGPKYKKFMSKNLRQLLRENAHRSLSEQKQVLENSFITWKGELDQVDDVCIIGVKIG